MYDVPLMKIVNCNEQELQAVLEHFFSNLPPGNRLRSSVNVIPSGIYTRQV